MNQGNPSRSDPAIVAVISAIERENLRRATIAEQGDRVAHFVQRSRELGMAPSETLIVILSMDDRCGAVLGDILMPGHDWDAIRRTGLRPFARGLAGRAGLTAGGDMFGIGKIEGIAVLVMDDGITATFSASELTSRA